MPKLDRTPIAVIRTRFAELTPLFKRRQDEEGYSSLSDYFFWLGFYDITLRKPHHFTAEIAHQSPAYQERAVRVVMENFEDGPKPGGFFYARLQEVALEETWVLHARLKEKDDTIRELRQELDGERQQGKFPMNSTPSPDQRTQEALNEKLRAERDALAARVRELEETLQRKAPKKRSKPSKNQGST